MKKLLTERRIAEIRIDVVNLLHRDSGISAVDLRAHAMDLSDHIETLHQRIRDRFHCTCAVSFLTGHVSGCPTLIANRLLEVDIQVTLIDTSGKHQEAHVDRLENGNLPEVVVSGNTVYLQSRNYLNTYRENTSQFITDDLK